MNNRPQYIMTVIGNSDDHKKAADLLDTLDSDYTLAIRFHDGQVTKPDLDQRAFVMTEHKEIVEAVCIDKGMGDIAPIWQITRNPMWHASCRWWTEHLQDPSWDQ